MILFILLKQFLEKAPLHLSNKWHVPPSRAHTHGWGESQMSSPGWFVLKQGPHTSTGLWVVLSLTYHTGEDFSTNPTLLETNRLFKIRVFLELLRGDGCVTYRDNGRVVIFFFHFRWITAVRPSRPSVRQSVCLSACLSLSPSVCGNSTLRFHLFRPASLTGRAESHLQKYNHSQRWHSHRWLTRCQTDTESSERRWLLLEDSIILLWHWSLERKMCPRSAQSGRCPTEKIFMVSPQILIRGQEVSKGNVRSRKSGQKYFCSR